MEKQGILDFVKFSCVCSVEGGPTEPSAEQSAKILKELMSTENSVDTWTSKEYLPRDWNEVEVCSNQKIFFENV